MLSRRVRAFARVLPPPVKRFGLSVVRAFRRFRFGVQSRTRSGREKLFSEIHANSSWGRGESVSGSGSSLEQTLNIRKALPALFSELEIHNLLDAPCGDVNWIREINGALNTYIGVDIVPRLIAGLSDSAKCNEVFLLADIVCDSLPTADAVLCRDALVHMPLKQATGAIENFRASGARFLIATTFPGRENGELPAGHWRPLDLSAQPFNLGAPIALINEGCTEGAGRFADKSLGVWRLR